MTTKNSNKPGMRYVEKEKVTTIKNRMKPDQFFHELAETFKALSDPTRAKIIFALCHENELCVHDIAAIIETTNSAISHQLRILRNMKLVKYNKVGKVAFYSLDDIHINNLFAEGLRHMEDK